MKLSIIIPTYREPDHLDLCLKSIKDSKNMDITYDYEVIVVVDGFYNENRDVLKKHEAGIHILDLGSNKGLSVATNWGVYNATGEYILVVNDDNVFPYNWPQIIKCIEAYEKKECAPVVLSLNQIEPRPSIFKQFIIKDLGQDPATFDLVRYNSYIKDNGENLITGERSTGSTLPFLMKKEAFLAVGGWDVMYPSPHVVDWDFFLKCSLNSFRMFRVYTAPFYHFANVATRKTPEQNQDTAEKEIDAHRFAFRKWGKRIGHDSRTNKKYLV